jgi:hypothetical protein
MWFNDVEYSILGYRMYVCMGYLPGYSPKNGLNDVEIPYIHHGF